MYAHVAVHENDNRATGSWNQGQSLYDARATFQVVDSHGCNLRIKRNATNGLQVSFSPVSPPLKRLGSKAGLERCFEAAEAALVYNAKVQQTGFEVLPGQKRRRGLKPTRYALRVVREACSIIEANYGKDCHFITLTLPGRTPEAIEVFARESTGILNAFWQRYRDFLKNEAPAIAGGADLSMVTEFGGSSSRKDAARDIAFENASCSVAEYHKDGALHFHCLIGLRDKAVVQVLRKKVKKWWRKILLTYSEKTGVDLFARKDGGTWKHCKHKPRVQFAKVKKSVTRYMAKYLSKIGRSDVCENWAPPASWNYVSDPVWVRVIAERNLKEVPLLTLEYAEEKATMFAEIAQKLGGKVYPTLNPFTEAVCGFQIFFDNDCKDEAYAEWSRCIDVMKFGLPELQPRAGPQPIDHVAEIEKVPDALEIFHGKELNPKAFGCAEFCAPFSAPEKGGGMR